MKKLLTITGSVFMVILMVSVVLSAYHHEGEVDSPNFLAQYPLIAGSKLDHCATCHTGGEYEKKPGKWVSLGSCQWCHYSYGYDGSGNIVDTLNSYGKDYWLNGRDQAALAAIGGLDSDGDGYTNAVEIAAIRYPGNADDDPSKVPAPSRVYTKAQLEAMAQHTQFMLMNTSRSGDFYAQYTGVPVEDLLQDAGILASATGITVFAPDGWSNFHPLELDSDPELYHVEGVYPEALYYYDTQADTALNPFSGWCDYSAPSCAGRSHQDLIVNPGGLKMLLAFKREGIDLDPGVLAEDNKLVGEGPYRLVPPQKVPSPPDQASNADDQDVIWPYDFNWDHSAGAASRSATIIRVEPLPEGTTDIDILEAGWTYVDEEKIVIYGAIAMDAPVADFTATPTAGIVPLSVHFTAQSTGIVTSWEWAFGDDNETSTEQNPSHTYYSPGFYTVSVTATGPGGSDTETKAHLIAAVSEYSYVQPEGNCNEHTPCYSSIQAGISAADAIAIFKIAEGAYPEDIVVNADKQIIFESGFDSTFTTPSGESKVNSVTVSEGTVTLKKGLLVIGK